MISIRRGTLMAIGAIAGTLAGAAPAAAVPRYAVPTGGNNTTSGCTSAEPPCELKYAVETRAQPGDEVILAPGPPDYTPASSVQVNKQLNIHGADGQPRPSVVGPGASPAFMTTAQVNGLMIRHLALVSQQTALLVGSGSTTAEDLVVNANAPNAVGAAAAIELSTGALLRNTIVRSADSDGYAVRVTSDTTSGTTNLRNVTAIAPGADSKAVVATSDFAGVCLGAALTVSVTNVIARGGSSDLEAQGENCTPANTATMAVSFSNYRSAKVTVVNDQSTVNQGPGNQTAVDPLLVSDTDPHQVAGSPTIDAGTTDGLVGGSDIDGEARFLGCAPDIGADERATGCPAATGPQGAVSQGVGGPVGAAAGTRAAASDLALSHSAFRAASGGPPATGARKRKTPVGTNVTYTLNQAASVRFTVRRRARGQRVKRGKKKLCATPRRKRRKAKRCTRVIRVGSFTRSGAVGRNSFRFTGRLRGRKLRPRRYELVATPIVAGQEGVSDSVRFRIVR